MSNSKPTCGVVMPISAIDECTEEHWADVWKILSDSIEYAGFEANLVSNADEVGLIHKRIIQNLYENPVVVCDVSGKNANVMFELGLRLAFDKPTIIVKDDRTSYSFDTSPIEHIEYPRDLRFSKIVSFKEKLSQKIKDTEETARTNSNYSTFLKHFGEFKLPKLEQREVSGEEYIIDEIKSLKSSLQRIEALMRHQDISSKNFLKRDRFLERLQERLHAPRNLKEEISDDINHGWKPENIYAHYLAQGHSEASIREYIESAIEN